MKLKELSEKLAIRCTRIRDIVQFEIRNGEKNCFLHRPDGTTEEIDRAKLIEEYRFLNNRKIKMLGVKVGRLYLAYKFDNTKFTAIAIMSDCTVDMYGDGREVPLREGSYILVRDDGYISIVDSVMFKKCFKIFREDKATFDATADRSVMVSLYGGGTQNVATSYSEPSVEAYQNQAVYRQEQTAGERASSAINRMNTNYPIATAVGKVVKNRVLVGLEIVSLDGMHRAHITMAKAYEMCSRHLISNLKLVNRNGTYFVSGIGGTTVESLPARYI